MKTTITLAIVFALAAVLAWFLRPSGHPMTTAQLEAMALTNDFPPADSPENIRDAPPGWIEDWKEAKRLPEGAIHRTGADEVRCIAKDGSISYAGIEVIDHGKIVLLDRRHTPPLQQAFFQTTNAAGRIVFVEK